ncbi:acyclic terpene utilization AtuA family protein [Achromobacter sp. NPDC058515]|uniref:acyclic terpene utilization AtuA family protein n=1 Tax=Achromobacter sp. NPDC058515 TaxID=3346533 RepID=UPI0036687633
MSRQIRIGGASGFWGDSATATPQLLAVPGMQYLVYDYLAETTMSILARARAKNPAMGYATDFVHSAMAPHLPAIMRAGIKVVANAGGLNPLACRDALLEVAGASGLAPRIAVVTGDDILPLAMKIRGEGQHALPASPYSANAYIGARGIAQALEDGAQIVITGRCVDSAVVLGVLVHEFGWQWRDWDRLAAGTLAGHVIECGAQATGGLYTDWQDVPGWDNMGYPVLDCASDGSFVVSKPAGTGGLIAAGCVSEQVLYEIGDPAAYLMPDVICDFRQVQVRQLDAGRVQVQGARGRPPTDTYKANATWRDGFQLSTLLAIRGIAARAKARKTADALLARTRRLLRENGYADYRDVAVEFLGCEALYGPHARHLPTREIMLRIVVRHDEPQALGFLQRECASAGTSMGPGTRSSFSGRPDIQPVIRVASFLVPKSQVPLELVQDGQRSAIPVDAPGDDAGAACPPEPAREARNEQPDDPREPAAVVALHALAWARSGDKGDDENIGVIARRPEFLPSIRRQLTGEKVRAYFAHLVAGEVERYDLPGLHALNFVMRQALGGGGIASLRSDPLGKSYAQMLLDHPMTVPRRWLDLGWVRPSEQD